MNQEQYTQLQNASLEKDVVGIADLINREPRTLIFGYTLDRNTFHVYLGKDQLIHVLLYAEVRSPDEDAISGTRFLIMEHTVGECGGITDNAQYTPSKRAYPESCDFEFSQILRRRGVHISFTTFTDKANDARLANYEGFAGYTFDSPGGCRAYSLHEHLAAHPDFPADKLGGQRLTSRLASQAARELGVHYTSSGDGQYVTVATLGSDKVLERARDFLRDLDDVDMEPGIGKRLAAEVFGNYHQFWMQDEGFYGGNATAMVSLEHVDFVADSSHQLFIGAPDGHYQKGILGSYSGRPFFACKTKSGETYLAYSQFGDTERFLKEQLRQFSLKPLVTD